MPAATPEKAKLQVRVDPVTFRQIDDLKRAGMFGTTHSEVCSHILRSWLWDNLAKLKETGVFVASAQSPSPPES